MTWSNFSQPLLSEKQEALDFQDLQGIWHINWKISDLTLYSGSYTRVDQVFIIWGLIATTIFTIAQFLPISWTTQAIFWTALTLVGTASAIALTWFWVSVERLRWVIYGWTILMLSGLALTDGGIFFGWGEVLLNLCPLWLGLSAVGYLFTGVGVRSRALLLVGSLHLLGIVFLPYVAPWQFLTTGGLMGLSLLLLAQMQWDMRSPIAYDLLTPEQKQFNQQQHQKRQLLDNV
ncbi:MAG: hypothetical protein KME17_30190 [Cyanosarcina radialis HA8281-LM2]|jgi:hypothetical protein|nr:hypothetical protein [Cyanosarcina radialis HA8281-LM2]